MARVLVHYRFGDDKSRDEFREKLTTLKSPFENYVPKTELLPFENMTDSVYKATIDPLTPESREKLVSALKGIAKTAPPGSRIYLEVPTNTPSLNIDSISLVG